MNKTQIFPLVLIILDLGAGIVYFCNGDIKRGIYWIAALVLTWAVTF
jgi:hypothetical protein